MASSHFKETTFCALPPSAMFVGAFFFQFVSCVAPRPDVTPHRLFFSERAGLCFYFWSQFHDYYGYLTVIMITKAPIRRVRLCSFKSSSNRIALAPLTLGHHLGSASHLSASYQIFSFCIIFSPCHLGIKCYWDLMSLAIAFSHSLHREQLWSLIPGTDLDYQL